MTAGSPVKHILRFSLPLMAGNIFQQLYTLADTAVVGNAIGIHALAALGTTEWLIFFINGAIMGITHGFSVVIAGYFGKQEDGKVKAAVINAALLSAAFALLFTILGQCLAALALQMLHVPEEAYSMAECYLHVIYGGIPVSFLYHMMAAVLRAFGNSKAPLWAVAISSAGNVVLDILFVCVFGWGIFGAAMATVLAEAVSVLYCMKMLKQIELLQMTRGDFRIDRHMMARELRMGLPLGIQNMVTAAGGLGVQSVINSFGVLFMAGYTAANKLYGLLEIPASTYGYTMSMFSAQNIGAGETDRAKRGLCSGLAISVVTAFMMSLIMKTGGNTIILCFINGGGENVAAVSKTAVDFLAVLAVFFPMLYILYTIRGFMQGAGFSVLPMASGFVQLAMRLSCAVFLTKIIGGYGVFWGEALAWIGADLLLFSGYVWWKSK